MRKYKISKADRKAWIEALESGKYEQGMSFLKRGNKYCCLGVFGELKDKHMSHFAMLRNIADIGGIPKCLLGTFDQNSFAGRLARMNDNGKSFKEIAKYIRKHTIGI